MSLILLRNKRLPPLTVLGLGTFAALCIAGSWYVWNEHAASRQHAATDKGWSLIARPITENDHLIGDVHAPIQVIVYSSISCSYCRTFFTVQLAKLQNAFPGKLVFAYRHNPIPQLPNAKIQEPAAECVYLAGGEEAFWRFVRELFPDAQSMQSVQPGYLQRVAQDAGVTGADFNRCMQQGNGKARVEQDAQEAAVGGLNSDPSFLIKTQHRALIIYGDYYSQVFTAIQTLASSEEAAAP